jgi:hypothetical protein
VPVSDAEHSSLVGTGAVKKFENKKIVSTNHQKYSYEEMTKDIQSLKQKYHGLVDYKIIGTSEDGRNIYDVVLGNKNAENTLVVVSTLHAREYMASLLCMNQIEYYLRNYYKQIDKKSVKDVLKQTAIHYIPMANPDGVTISQKGIRSIKNAALRQKLYKISGGSTQTWKANARGIDLNRNFPYQFKKFGKAGSEGCSGTSAASESETRAVLSLLEKLQTEDTLRGVVNYHAMGSIVFGSCKKKNSAKKTTTKMYRLARSITGYSSAAGYTSSTSDKYGEAGNLREYLVYKKKIPSITLEIGKGSCPGSISEFPSIWDKNYSLVFREAALFCK